ncbi:DegV family protein [Clostridium vitabionis]|jgi:DegV family protein with EDD domain|uniref:DegV family protein n=1 Tax=Clostridium vitabionis TaxID=2784388 RepID=UPI00188ABB0D|nr:DegV family protein [Clostridium vitabionis]
MKYRIVGDSCLDPTEEVKRDPHFRVVPLTLEVGETRVIDDETFDQKKFLKLVADSPAGAKTACPSPERFMQEFDGDADCVFVVTLSSHLSGSYNSACVAKKMYEEEHGGEKKIEVIDSRSASCGELNIALTIRDLCERELPFEEIVREAYAYRDRMQTYFVLESLDTLRKNGRLSGLSAFIATTLNIKPVMAGDKGVIVKLSQERGINKALTRMVKIALEKAGETASKRLIIAHVNNPARAEFVRDLMCRANQFREVLITNAAGVATVYAADGGIVMTL